MIRVFTGFDQREAMGWHAFSQSVIERASEPVSLVALGRSTAQRDGSNAFTYARFLVPYLCDFEGFAIFVDGADMIACEDFAKLWALRDEDKAVQVVKHSYATKHPRKYIGTAMECENRDYPRKNWSSAMIWNCGHSQNALLKPELIDEATGLWLHSFEWLRDEEIGELPAAWNWLVDEFGTNLDAALLHFTAGIPAIPHYNRTAHAQRWFLAHARANELPTMPPQLQVGLSVH